jgi:hypothetical protein
MQSPNVGAPINLPRRQSWPVHKDMDGLILRYLGSTDLDNLRLSARFFRSIVDEFERTVQANQQKPEKYRNYTWRQIAYLERKLHPSIPGILKVKTQAFKHVSSRSIGAMICLKGEEVQRLITSDAELFRDLPLDCEILDCSFLSALIYKPQLKRCEWLEQNSQTRLSLPESTELFAPYKGIIYNKANNVALIADWEKKRVIVLGPKNQLARLENFEVGLKGKLTASANRLIVIDNANVTMIKENHEKVTYTYPASVKYVQCEVDKYIVSTRQHLYFESLDGRRLRVITKASPHVYSMGETLISYRDGKFTINAMNKQVNSISKSQDFNLFAQLLSIPSFELKSIRLLNDNLVAFVLQPPNYQLSLPILYNIKDNDFKEVTQAMYGSHHWITNRLIFVLVDGSCAKVV